MKINIIFAYRFRIEGRKFARRVNPLIRVTSGDIYVYIFIYMYIRGWRIELSRERRASGRK